MFLLYYAGPFIGIALLLLLWFYIAHKLERRVPWFYTFTIRMYGSLPKIGAFVVIVAFLYFFLTQPSYYDW